MDGDNRTSGFSATDIEDFWPRLLVSPVLGALVANFSGLIDYTRHSIAVLIASDAWFSLVAFLVWEGNRRLYFRLQRREDWLLRPWRRLGLLVAVICLFTIPVATTLLWMWREVSGDHGTRQYALPTALFAIVAVVVAITHVYETVFLLRDWESDRLRSTTGRLSGLSSRRAINRVLRTRPAQASRGRRRSPRRPRGCAESARRHLEPIRRDCVRARLSRHSADACVRPWRSGHTPVTFFDRAQGEIVHRWPAFLPNGIHFLYSIVSLRDDPRGVYVGSVDASPTRSSQPLFASESAAIYAPVGAGRACCCRSATAESNIDGSIRRGSRATRGRSTSARSAPRPIMRRYLARQPTCWRTAQS